MLSGVKDILAKAKEARDDFKTTVAPELDRSRQRLTQQLKKSAESVKKYTSRLPTSVTEPSLILRKEQLMGNCDVDACSGILAQYQQQWSHMADDTQQSASDATDIDNRVQTILRKSLVQQEALTSFQRQLEQMPALIETLASAQRSMATLSINVTQTEAALGRLETLIDRLDLQRREDVETRLFERHQKARRQELEHLRASVAETERRRDEQQKQAEAAKRHERQMAFAAVHQQEIKLFKEKGEIEKISRPRGASSASLDDYQCIDDSGEYENFLSEAADVSTASELPTAGARADDAGAAGAGEEISASGAGGSAGVEQTDTAAARGGDRPDSEDAVAADSEDTETTGERCEVASDADPALDPSLLIVASPAFSPTLSPTLSPMPDAQGVDSDGDD